MPTCPNCKTQLPDDSKFCNSCGAPIANSVFCPKCGKPINTELGYCQNCANPATVAVPEPVRPEKKKGKLHLKPLIIAAAAVIVVAAAVLAILFFINQDTSKEFALYLKDDELNYTRTSKIEPFELTSSLYDGSIAESEAYGLAYLTLISQDGKTIFFPDKVSTDSNGCSIYYRLLDKPDQDAEKIDSDILKYAINDKADLITYIKGEERYLYQSNLKDKEKIGSNVTDFYLNTDGSKIIFVDADGTIYSKNASEDKEKIDSNSSIHYVSEDLSTIYYLKEDSLYKKQEGQDKVKISSDVSGIVSVYDTGEVYFYKTDSSDPSLSEYVDDDMAAADAGLQVPEMPVYPSWWDYTTIEEYEQAQAEYDAAYEIYIQASTAYNEKMIRDDLRASLASQTMTISQSTLYYYSGTEEKAISDTFVESSCIPAADKAVMLYQGYVQSDIKKIKLSELQSTSEINSMIQKALYESTERNLVIGGVSDVFELDETYNLMLNDTGTELYYIDNLDDDNHGDLNKIIIAEGKAQTAEIYDTDVSTMGIRFLDDSSLAYYKDVNDDSGELYRNKTKIDYDVRIWSEDFSKDKNTIVYFSDWDSDKQLGTLKVYTKEESSKIADDVHSFYALPSSNVLYLYDYSSTRFKGELHLYDGSEENEKIDDDVTAIIPILTSSVRSVYFGD